MKEVIKQHRNISILHNMNKQAVLRGKSGPQNTVLG